MTIDPQTDDTPPGVAVHPPILVVALLLAAWGLDALLPLSLGPVAGQRTAGLAVAGLGLAIAGLAALQFRRAGTGIPTYRPARTLVTTGLYRHSRNPIYVGLIVFLAGLGPALDTLWLPILVPVLAVVLTSAVIRREERYLSARFGPDYAAYRARTRRWI